MTTQQKIKQVLINLAEDDELPLDLNELDPSVFDECLIEYDGIRYEGEEYAIRSVGGYLFSNELLLNHLWDDSKNCPKDEEAERIDDTIAYFFDVHEFYTLTDEELLEIYENL